MHLHAKKRNQTLKTISESAGRRPTNHKGNQWDVVYVCVVAINKYHRVIETVSQKSQTH